MTIKIKAQVSLCLIDIVGYGSVTATPNLFSLSARFVEIAQHNLLVLYLISVSVHFKFVLSSCMASQEDNAAE